MPVPNPVNPDGQDPSIRFAMQAAVFSCYLLVAIALLFAAWRISASTEMMDRVMEQQTTILREIREARNAIPTEVKSTVKDAIRGKVR